MYLCRLSLFDPVLKPETEKGGGGLKHIIWTCFYISIWVWFWNKSTYNNRYITQEVVEADPWDRVWQYLLSKSF